MLEEERSRGCEDGMAVSRVSRVIVGEWWKVALVRMDCNVEQMVMMDFLSWYKTWACTLSQSGGGVGMEIEIGGVKYLSNRGVTSKVLIGTS